MLGKTVPIVQNLKNIGRFLNRKITLYHQSGSARLAHRTYYTMDKVYLRNDSDSAELHISFRYANEDLKVDRDFNFCRKMNEKIEDALNRIRGNIEKEFSKKMKKGKKKTSALADKPPEDALLTEITTEFRRRDRKLEDITFAEMLAEETDNLKLKVLDHSFDVVVNLPWVTNLLLPTSILAGFIVYPSKVETKFADKHSCKAVWFKSKMPSSGNIQQANWERCGEGFSYNTTNTDIGYYLKLQLTPGNEKGQFGPLVENVSKTNVQAGPGPCPFETRHYLTGTRLQRDAFRVVSYNLLADLYADSDYSRTHLFPYCPMYALKVEYRKQLYIKELLGYNADIICLQEVDLKIFDNDLKAVFEDPTQGFKGIIAQKGVCGEGVATFFRTDRFELVESISFNFGAELKNSEVLKSLWDSIKFNNKLAERICDRSTTLQLTLLRGVENDRYLLVANTHLYFHPDADHIRLLQAGVAMLIIEDVFKKTLVKYNIQHDEQLAIVFCGDLNSVPECGIFSLFTTGTVDSHCIDWRSNAEQAVENVSLSQPYCFKSACGTPDYTNFTPDFAACLDYIFYQCDRLEVEQYVPLPSKQELTAHIAIPSVVFPSDHVALVADLKFKPLLNIT